MDERDPVIERLMRQARTEPRTPEACPDAEMLAAWSEGGLRQVERDGLERHVADCARCQAILAATVEPVPAPAVVPVSLWRRWHLEWVVPIAAAAAAAIVWMVVPSDAPSAVTESARVEPRDVAIGGEVRLGGAAATESAQERAAQTIEQPAAQPPPSRTDLIDEPQALRRQAATGAKPSPEPTPAQPEARAAADAAAVARKEQTAAETVATAGQVVGGTLSATAPPPAPAAAAAPVPAAAQPPPVPPPPGADTAFKPDQAPPAGRGGRGGAPAGAGAGMGTGSGSGIGAGTGAAPVSGVVYGVVISPEPAIRWRFSNLGTVDLSTNVGATWDRLQFGVIGALVAGSSPAPTICWIVGRSGVVIVTTDTRTWRRLPFPEATDLTAVQATDAQNATVTAGDGRRWQTRDGGASWSTLQDF